MYFKDRTEAGQLLAKALKKYKDRDVVVYALPRGGVVTAVEIAKYLNAPLDLIIARKIGHPQQPEYAIAASAENGHMVVGDKREIETVDKVWLKEEIDRQRLEAKRRRELYLGVRSEVPVEGKIAILVDDGIATGLTLRMGIMELKHRNPQKIVVAVPVAPKDTADKIKMEVDEFVALDTPSDFLGAVGSYYEDFFPVEDEEVIALMSLYEKKHPGMLASRKMGMLSPDPVLFAFPKYRYMVDDLNLLPNFTIGKYKLERFTNNELHLKIATEAALRPCIIIGTIAPPETNLVSFLLLAHTLKKENAHKIIAILPYLSYARHDKKEPRKSYATALIGSLFAAAGIDEVLTVDIHSPHAKRLFPISLKSLSPAAVFAAEIKKIGFTDATFIAPDEGAVRRSSDVAKELGSKKNISYFVKTRTKQGIVHSKLYGKVGKKAVVIDDILDTGGTLISACERLVENGVSEIVIMVTHGLFTGNKWKRLWKLNVKHIYCTDSIPVLKGVKGRIRVLSIIPLLTEEAGNEFQKSFMTRSGRSFERYDEP